MGKIVKLRVRKLRGRDLDLENEYIDPIAELIAVDEGEHFKVHQSFPINLDEDPDEKIQQIIKEAESWISNSRKRIARAKMIAEMLGIELEISPR